MFEGAHMLRELGRQVDRRLELVRRRPELGRFVDLQKCSCRRLRQLIRERDQFCDSISLSLRFEHFWSSISFKKINAVASIKTYPGRQAQKQTCRSSSKSFASSSVDYLLRTRWTCPCSVEEIPGTIWIEDRNSSIFRETETFRFELEILLVIKIRNCRKVPGSSL